MLGPCDYCGSKEKPRSLRIRANAAQKRGRKKREKGREEKVNHLRASVEKETEGETEKDEVSKFG